MNSPAPIVWDIERDGSSCSRCGSFIGAGEAFRRARRIIGRKYCEPCSIAIDGTPAPAGIHAMDFAERMRADIAAGPSPRREDAPAPVRPGSQPAAKPRGC